MVSTTTCRSIIVSTILLPSTCTSTGHLYLRCFHCKTYT